MANVTYMEAIFGNGDKLILKLQMEKFATYVPKRLYSVFFAEYTGGTSYNVYQTEYFPETEFNSAASAFRTRMSSNNPMNESDQGWDLNTLLTKKPTPNPY